MNIYEVRVEKVNADGGKHLGYETIGFCINKNKANELAKAFAEKHEINQWWMSYGQNAEGHINVEMVNRGEA